MKTRLLNWLICPTCRGELELRVPSASDGVTMSDSDSIDYGALTCGRCAVYYPIWNGVPRMLTYSSAVVDVHARHAAAWVSRALAGFARPHGRPPKGERRILRNFSTEWLGYTWTGESYWNLTADNMLQCKLYELGVSPGELKGKLLLEVGIGIGGTADALSRTEDCEVVGMDLGYAVEQAQRYFGGNPRLHIVQASVFAPPFRSHAFDVVYSHGVIHHTCSTQDAFDKLTALPREDGLLYVWVYSHQQEKATPLRRALMLVEQATRPVISRLPTTLQTVALLPAVPFYVLYQNLYARRVLGAEYAARYGWNEALHAARDRLTPPFAFRHSYEEVVRWFENHSYTRISRIRDEALPEGVPESYPLNVGVRGRKGVAMTTVSGGPASHAVPSGVRSEDPCAS